MIRNMQKMRKQRKGRKERERRKGSRKGTRGEYTVDIIRLCLSGGKKRSIFPHFLFLLFSVLPSLFPLLYLSIFSTPYSPFWWRGGGAGVAWMATAASCVYLRDLTAGSVSFTNITLSFMCNRWRCSDTPCSMVRMVSGISLLIYLFGLSVRFCP